MGQSLPGSNRNRLVSAFLVGGFISNLGSLVFQIGFVIYAVEIGWSLPFVGLVLALCRYAQIGSNLFLGEIGDRANARRRLIATDVVGGLTDIAIILVSLELQQIPEIWLFALLLLRNFSIGLQTPLRAKIGKVLSERDPLASRHIAINLNIVAQGTTLFGAIFVLLVKRQTGFAGICVFDLVTFGFSAFATFLLPNSAFVVSQARKFKPWVWLGKFRDYFVFDRGLFWRDVLLSFPVWGTQALFLRTSNGQKDLLPYFWIVYGLSVIVTGQVAKSNKMSEKLKGAPTSWLWFVQALCFFAFMLSASNLALALTTLFFAYSVYFLSLHNLSAEYQERVGSDIFAGIASARGIIAIMIISSGEMVVGWTSQFLSVSREGAVRAAFCGLIGIIFMVKSYAATTK